MASTGKTLSKGTLSLRFMQNAHRAQNVALVEADRAKVKDDAEWEVMPEVRAAWGPGTSSVFVSLCSLVELGVDLAFGFWGLCSAEVIHETSYIPFLFPDSTTDSVARGPNGRRTFGNMEPETTQVSSFPLNHPPPSESYSQPPPEAAPPLTDAESEPESPPPRPKKSILSSGPIISAKKAGKTKTKDPSLKPARELIRDSSGVGIDMRPVNARPPKIAESFMRPSGVDAPARKTDPGADSGALPPARKRERDLAGETGPGDGVVKKRKKKRTTESEV
jgi:hypothetical protein